MNTVPIKATIKNHPPVPWKYRTTAQSYGLPKEFRGLVLIEDTQEVYFMWEKDVVFVDYLQYLLKD